MSGEKKEKNKHIVDRYWEMKKIKIKISLCISARGDAELAGYSTGKRRDLQLLVMRPTTNKPTSSS